jgi:hypothetical protein
VIYFSIVVYSFYSDLKGVKSQQDTPDKTDSPRNVMPPGSSTSPGVRFIPPKTEENVHSNVTALNARNNSGFIAGSARQGNQYQTEENVHSNVAALSSRNNLAFAARSAGQGNQYQTEEYAYSNVTTPSARNNVEFAASSAGQDNQYQTYYEIPDRYPEK